MLEPERGRVPGCNFQVHWLLHLQVLRNSPTRGEVKKCCTLVEVNSERILVVMSQKNHGLVGCLVTKVFSYQLSVYLPNMSPHFHLPDYRWTTHTPFFEPYPFHLLLRNQSSNTAASSWIRLKFCQGNIWFLDQKAFCSWSGCMVISLPGATNWPKFKII